MNSSSTTLHTPTYILRRRIILHLLSRYVPGRFLEIGCGRGDLLPHLARLGFDGVGLEISSAVFPTAREIARPYEPRLMVANDPRELERQHFRYVFAFDVLEHIENDAAALIEWRKWLSPGGRLVVTVPAHMTKWTASDDAVGHFRRYERDNLHRLLAECGYKIDVFWSYGFPLINVTRCIRRLFHKTSPHSICTDSKQDRTLRSSLESTVDLSRFGSGATFLASPIEMMISTFHLTQLPFRDTDLGDGYIVACQPTEN